MTKPKIPINTFSKLLTQKRALQDLSAHSNRRFYPTSQISILPIFWYTLLTS